MMQIFRNQYITFAFSGNKVMIMLRKSERGITVKLKTWLRFSFGTMRNRQNTFYYAYLPFLFVGITERTERHSSKA